jgi:hypothetical protein
MRFLVLLVPMLSMAAIVPADISTVRPGPVTVAASTEALTVQWLDETNRSWSAEFSLDTEQPLITNIRLDGKAVIRNANPQYWVTTGIRRGRAGFDEFADFPGDHPEGTRHFWGELRPTSATARTVGNRVEVFFSGLKMGIFEGGVAYTFFPGSRLIQQEAVASTQTPRTAYFYDTGLRMAAPADTVRPGQREVETPVTYYDVNGKLQTVMTDGPDRRPAYVRYRTIAAKTDAGSVAVFPAPHQYFLLRDYTTNLGYVWHHGWYGRIGPGELGLGVRQLPDDASPGYPWMNAPPGTTQRMSVFYLVSGGAAEDLLEDVLRYTNRDRFPALPGYKTLLSHFHWGMTMKALDRGEDNVRPYRERLMNMGVDAVMTCDFHSDGHPHDVTGVRLDELDAYYRLGRKLSDSKFLMIPAEEANSHLGGHWIVAFPKPVLWFMDRASEGPLVRQDPKYGKVYHVGSPEDVIEMVRLEKGIVYTTHPRTKSSFGYPDKYRDQDFFLDPRFFGVGWKQMPADLSTLRQGVRAFKLLDDMSNWGLSKGLFAEVDTFHIGPTHELYPHLNVNYVRIDELPGLDDYSPLLEAVQRGDYFVSTGEVLLPEVKISTASPSTITATVSAQWAFPLAFGELVWGDGNQTFTQSFPLNETRPFGNATFEWETDAKDWKWARVAVWDVAGNGGFINPVRH